VTATTSTAARTRILDAALTLIGDHGVAGMSMRQLAGASALNVATIYHYFPSKADVLGAVIAERRYNTQLIDDRPPLDPSLPPVERLGTLVEWFWTGALGEESIWRVLMGEAIRGDPAAIATSTEIVAAFGDLLESWLHDAFPEVAPHRAEMAHVLRGVVLALVVEHLVLGPVTPAQARARAEDLATVAMR
jgi:AcrR family transcriptional regulator